jgi:hypothetical protein
LFTNIKEGTGNNNKITRYSNKIVGRKLEEQKRTSRGKECH